MNTATITAIAKAFSMKRELKIVSFAFATVLILPVIAVLLITQAGIDAISDTLVSRNPQNTQVDIRNPANGEIVDRVDTTAMWPVTGPVTLEFGEPSPYQLFHSGIDIADPNGQVGTPVVAFMAGKVTYADTINWGFGRHVVIDNGHFVTSIYAHLDSLNVIVGQEVEAGTIIGTRGSTGWSTGPHLHFQINVFRIPVNPRVFLDGEPGE